MYHGVSLAFNKPKTMFLGDSRRIKKDVVWKKYRSKKHFVYFPITWYMTQHAYHFYAVYSTCTHLFVEECSLRVTTQKKIKKMNKKTGLSLFDSGCACCKNVNLTKIRRALTAYSQKTVKIVGKMHDEFSVIFKLLFAIIPSILARFE